MSNKKIIIKPLVTFFILLMFLLIVYLLSRESIEKFANIRFDLHVDPKTDFNVSFKL
jgi:hypothetical protein